MQKRPVAVGVALAGALILSACGGGSGDGAASGKSYDWDFTVTTGNTSTWYEGAQEFAKVLDDKSDGRMKVNIVTNEQLSGGDPAAGVEQLMSGEKAFSYNSTIIYAGIDERFGAVNAPFLFTDLDQVDAQKDKVVAAYTKIGAEKGVQVLGMGESGFRQITNNVRPITKPEDLKGIKLRIPGIGLFTDVYKTLGANPTTMNWSEVFTALQQKTIEGQENPIDIIYSSGLEEVQSNLTVWNYVYDPLILGMNKDEYDSLSDEDKKIVDEAAKAANELQIKNNRAKEDGELKELKDKMDVVELTADQQKAFKDAVAPVYDKYKDTWGQEMVDAVTPQG